MIADLDTSGGNIGKKQGIKGDSTACQRFNDPMSEKPKAISTYLNRSSWLKGEWDDEPDRIYWESNGYPCLARRTPNLGVWCGYVAVGSDHPFFGKTIDEVERYISIHGGVTYCGYSFGDIETGVEHPTKLEPVWWIGFDCGHAYDVSPVLDALITLSSNEEYLGMPKFYRNQAYIQVEIKRLRVQLEVFTELIGKKT